MRFISAGASPRKPSLAPSAMTTMRTSPSSAQSSRRSPPAVVSPDTPALTTSNRWPSRIEPRLQLRRKRPSRRRQAVPGGQAVAQNDHTRRRCSGTRRWRALAARLARLRRLVGRRFDGCEASEARQATSSSDESRATTKPHGARSSLCYSSRARPGLPRPLTPHRACEGSSQCARRSCRRLTIVSLGSPASAAPATGRRPQIASSRHREQARLVRGWIHKRFDDDAARPHAPRRHRHVDHRLARVQRRSGVPLDGAADDLLVAAADDPRVLRPGRGQGRRASLHWTLRLRRTVHGGPDPQRRPVGGLEQGRRGAQAQGDRHRRLRALEPCRRADGQRARQSAESARPDVCAAREVGRAARGGLARGRSCPKRPPPIGTSCASRTR